MPLLALSALAAERDYSFLPDPVASYVGGDGAKRGISREQAVQLLKSKFTPEQLSIKSEGEIRTEVRMLSDSLFERRVMSRILRENNVKPDPDTMRKELRHLHNSLPPAERAGIESQLIRQGSTYEDSLREMVNDPDQVTRYAFIQWVKQNTEKKIVVTDREAEDFYRANQAMFLLPESFTLSRILQPTKADADALYTRLALGEKFENLAKGRGGKYGEFSRNDLDDPILAAVDPLKEGQYSKVIKQNDGWAIFHMDSRQKASFVPLDEMRDFIENQIRLLKVQVEVQRIIQAERKAFKFELNL